MFPGQLRCRKLHAAWLAKVKWYHEIGGATRLLLAWAFTEGKPENSPGRLHAERWGAARAQPPLPRLGDAAAGRSAPCVAGPARIICQHSLQPRVQVTSSSSCAGCEDAAQHWDHCSKRGRDCSGSWPLSAMCGRPCRISQSARCADRAALHSVCAAMQGHATGAVSTAGIATGWTT